MSSNNVISTATVDIVASVTRPMVQAGALHRTEQQAVVRILNKYVAGKNHQDAALTALKISEVSKMLGVSTKTILRMVKGGELQGRYLRPNSPKTLRIARSSVEALITGKEEA